MPKIIGNPTVTPMAISDWNQTDPTKADFIKNKPDIFTKKETNDLLDKKANKSDISNVYKFKGSVDTFNEYMAAATYELIPCDNPTYEGRVVGTYNAEERTVFIDSKLLPGWEDYDVVVPIEKITVPKGYYNCDDYISVAGMDGYWFSFGDTAYKKTDEEVVTEVHIGNYGYLESGTYQLGTLNKLSSVQVELAENPTYGAEYEVVDTLEVGDVYNVLDTDVNCAWTGTEWDALGGTVSGGVDIIHRQDKNNPHSVTASQVGAYTKQEVDSKLSNKVNKSDMTNIYKFMGSVETFDEELMTPATYEIVPKGNPTYNGVVVGTYDAENRTVTIDSNKLEGWEDYEVVVPIEEIVVPKGYYSCKGDISIAGMDGYWVDSQYVYKKNNEEIVTTVSIGYYGYHGAGTIELGNLKKYSSVEVELAETPFYNADYQVIATLETGDVYNALDTGINYAWTGTQWDALGGEHKDAEHRDNKDNPHEVTASQVGAYTKSETNKLLNEKANKEDIVSAYKFCGSIDTFDEELMTPATYEIVPKGEPTYNGIVVGTYDAEKRTVTIDSNKLEGWDGYGVKVQIEPITISKGYYSFDNAVGVLDENGAILISGYFYPEYAWDINDTMTISEVYVGTQGYSYSGTRSLGGLIKYSSVKVKEDTGIATSFKVIGNLESGDVYNVLTDGMNYAWTGTEWDALGGEHKDLEARADIENLEIQVGDIETALDSIIEIQNSLIGGESV